MIGPKLEHTRTRRDEETRFLSPPLRLQTLHPATSSTQVLSLHHLLKISHSNRIGSVRRHRSRSCKRRRSEVQVAPCWWVGKVHRRSSDVVGGTSDHLDVESGRRLLLLGVGRLELLSEGVASVIAAVVLAWTRRLLESSEGRIVG